MHELTVNFELERISQFTRGCKIQFSVQVFLMIILDFTCKESRGEFRGKQFL